MYKMIKIAAIINTISKIVPAAIIPVRSVDSTSIAVSHKSPITDNDKM